MYPLSPTSMEGSLGLKIEFHSCLSLIQIIEFSWPKVYEITKEIGKFILNIVYGGLINDFYGVIDEIRTH